MELPGSGKRSGGGRSFGRSTLNIGETRVPLYRRRFTGKTGQGVDEASTYQASVWGFEEKQLTAACIQKISAH